MGGWPVDSDLSLVQTMLKTLGVAKTLRLLYISKPKNDDEEEKKEQLKAHDSTCTIL
jgi:hypothetical protein